MRRLAVLLTLLLLQAACDQSPLEAEPEDIDSCEDLAAATVGVLQEQLDEVAGLSLEEVLAEPGPPELEDLEMRGDELTARSAAIGCDDAQMNASIRRGVAELTAEGPIAEIFLQTIRDRLGS